MTNIVAAVLASPSSNLASRLQRIPEELIDRCLSWSLVAAD